MNLAPVQLPVTQKLFSPMQAPDTNENSASPDQNFTLGMHYLETEDYTSAAHYFCLAADQSHSEASEELKKMFLNGQGINPDTRSRALDCLEPLAQNGLAQAKLQLGILYDFTNILRAMVLLKEAADENIPDALNRLVDLICRFPWSRDALGEETAENYLKKAVDELGHVRAAHMYAQICAYRKSRSWDKESPKVVALRYYKIAADLGDKLAAFMHLALEVDLETSSDLKNALTSAFSWFSSDEKSHQKQLADKTFKVGIAYMYGDKKIGLSKDLFTAEKFLARAVTLGNEEAILKHGIAAYQLARKSSKPSEDYIKYLRIATAANYQPAILEWTIVVEFSYMRHANSVELAREAAYTLYLYHIEGDSFLEIRKDKKQAVHWLSFAAELNHLDALEKVMEVWPERFKDGKERLKKIKENNLASKEIEADQLLQLARRKTEPSLFETIITSVTSHIESVMSNNSTSSATTQSTPSSNKIEEQPNSASKQTSFARHGYLEEDYYGNKY